MEVAWTGLSVTCPELGSCVAFGEYTNHAGATRDMEVTGWTAPENTVAPTVSAMAEVGQALMCSQGSWTASPTYYAYKWLRNGVAIAGAETGVYMVTAADEGHSISCEVTASNIAGSKSTASANSVAIREEAREKREQEEATAKSQAEEAAATAKKHQEAATVITRSRKKKQSHACRQGVAGRVQRQCPA